MGRYVDTPCHILHSGRSLDQFPMDKFIGSEMVIDCRGRNEIIPNHHILLAKEIFLIENLTNLDKLPDHAFTFQCFPQKVENADGSPIRAIAVIDE